MSINLAIIGLALIFIAWLVQFFSMNKRREVSKLFLLTYIFGLAFLIYQGHKSGMVYEAIINGLVAIAVICVLIRFSKPLH
jgi:hypothetical protein